MIALTAFLAGAFFAGICLLATFAAILKDMHERDVREAEREKDTRASTMISPRGLNERVANRN